uniref:Sphingomyelin phosphodiesterase n=1 Tax=Glossina pallidipes TaxID=7398 RepID=A0A1A9ZZL3_GLOPL
MSTQLNVAIKISILSALHFDKRSKRLNVNKKMLWVSIIFLIFTATNAVELSGILKLFTPNDVILSAAADNMVSKLEKEYMKYLETGVETPTFNYLTMQLGSSRNGMNKYVRNIHKLKPVDEFFVCVVCRAMVGVIDRTFRDEQNDLNGPKGDAMAKKIAMDACQRLKIQTKEVCEGLFDGHWPILRYIIENTSVDAKTICSFYIQFTFCNVADHPKFNFNLELDDADQPSIIASKSNRGRKTSKDLNILHLTDIHHDPLYEPGSLAECDEPLCCQRHKSLAIGTSKAAGYWGDYRECDLPWHTVNQAFTHIRQAHADIDYIFQTGDVIDHMIWSTSMAKNKVVYERVVKRIYELFPEVPVYPCIGNHEAHPLNLFSPTYAPDSVNSHWLYEFLYDIWSKWLPADTKETILRGGYYTALARPGYRIISLNNNDCYTDNWWLFYNGTDMKTQLMWLYETLLAAEGANEHVHILAHLPSGDDTCWNVWSREFNRLVRRFRETISGIFNGHSHADEMHVHYTSGGYAVAVTFNGGALTTWTYKNPNYRIYRVEPKTLQVVDHETWIFNLTAANIAGAAESPRWFKEYIFSEEFTDDLSPAGLDNLLEQMADNPRLLEKFWRFKMLSTDQRLRKGCNRSCMLKTICRLAVTVNDQRRRCEELTAKLTKAMDSSYE